MANKSEQEVLLIEEKIENFLRDNPSRSYSKNEIINFQLIHLTEIKSKIY